MQLKKGFTLIEMLLVIAIIGMASSVTFQNLNSAREKARVATTQQFSQSVQNLLGNDKVTEFDFEGKTSDTGGYDLGVTLRNLPNPRYVEGLFGSAVNLTGEATGGSSDYIRINTTATANALMENTAAGTIEVSFMLTKENAGGGIVTWRNYRPALRTLRIGDEPHFVAYWLNATGMDCGNRTCGVEIIPNKWHHVIFSWTADYKDTGAGYYKLWYNNEIVEEGDFTPSQQENVASDIGIAGGFNNFIGYVDNIRVYNEFLE